MNRAIDKDPTFQHSVVIPVIREDCTLPSQLTPPSPPLYVDLQDDKDTAQWHSLLTVCGADLGVPAPEWIRARNDIRRFLQRNESVNWSGYTLLDKWMQENPVTM